MNARLRGLLPNAITMVRLVLAVAFLAVLLRARHQDCQCRADLGTLATVLFIVAALSDILDGYLARRWQVVTRFGRIMDPFGDKLLVLGALVALAAPGLAEGSGIDPWVVLLVLGRELFVTSVRAVAEADGVQFAADRWGKLKMFLQCVAVPFAIFVATHADTQDSASWLLWRDSTRWAMILSTALSAIPYAIRAVGLLRPLGGGAR